MTDLNTLSPCPEELAKDGYFDMARGKKEVTLRDMGEISHFAKMDLQVSFTERRALSAQEAE